MMFLMSQDRPSSRDGSTKIINMNHVLTHSHPTASQMQYNNNNNIILNKNNFLTIETTNSSANSHLIVHKNISPMPSLSSPSPGASMSYITTISANGNDQNVINGNHHPQIVLVTNEKLEAYDNEQTPDDEERKTSNGATDEELTSLTWLHDKNLLKGINLSCPKVQSPATSEQTLNGTRLSIISKSPSDDKDDSGVSFNSSLEQLEHYTSSPSSPRPLNFTKIDNNANIEVTNCLSSKSLEKSSHHNLSNSSHIDIIKLIAGQPENNVNIVKIHQQNNNLSSEESINQIIKSPAPHHQHFHKRYLREQTLKQQEQDEEKRQQQQEQQQHHHHLQLQSTQLSSYIIAKPQSENRYMFNEDHAITTYHNNNNSIAQNNYESEYDLSQKVIDYAMPKLNSTASSVASSLSPSPSPKQKQQQHPNNIPYDPLIHTTSKPPYSFSSLIFMAIEDSLQKALPVKEIYAWIIQHFPYFKTAPTGWKNSVRHNLSLNKCFQKVEKAANLGKGSLWMVEPQYRPNLIQALTRSPFHPCSTWEKHAKNLIKSPNESPGSKTNNNNNNSNARLPNPEHFPFLSRRLAAAMENYEDDGKEQSRSSTPSTNYEMPQNGVPVYQNNNSIIINGNLPNSELFARELNAETIDDVNAATAMLALKHGPKIFTDGIPFVQPPILTTTSPSEDHTYSAFGKNGTDNNSNGTSSDAAYESSEESNVVYHFTQPLNEQELEEQRRQAEGVDALLNLAGYNTNTTLLLKRPATDDQQFERKQYFYTTEISPSNKNYITNDEPPSKKVSKSRILRNKLKRKSWIR